MAFTIFAKNDTIEAGLMNDNFYHFAQGHVYPRDGNSLTIDTTKEWDIGSSLAQWKDVYCETLHVGVTVTSRANAWVNLVDEITVNTFSIIQISIPPEVYSECKLDVAMMKGSEGATTTDHYMEFKFFWNTTTPVLFPIQTRQISSAGSITTNLYQVSSNHNHPLFEQVGEADTATAEDVGIIRSTFNINTDEVKFVMGRSFIGAVEAATFTMSKFDAVAIVRDTSGSTYLTITSIILKPRYNKFFGPDTRVQLWGKLI